MAKYHVGKNGKVSKCTAFLRACPLGEHFNTEQEAKEYFQAQVNNPWLKPQACKKA